jgi:hypothetical protein
MRVHTTSSEIDLFMCFDHAHRPFEFNLFSKHPKNRQQRCNETQRIKGVVQLEWHSPIVCRPFILAEYEGCCKMSTVMVRNGLYGAAVLTLFKAVVGSLG